jgi:hypothetical protein
MRVKCATQQDENAPLGQMDFPHDKALFPWLVRLSCVHPQNPVLFVHDARFHIYATEINCTPSNLGVTAIVVVIVLGPAVAVHYRNVLRVPLFEVRVLLPEGGQEKGNV